MQGVFVDGARPKSKKQVKEMAKADPSRILIEVTSMFGNEYGGPADNMPDGASITFVGPDPYTKRNFYGTIKRRGNVVAVS